MWVVLAYDVPDDERRARLHRRLSARLTRVQLSVFEGEVRPAALPALITLVRALIEPGKDDVRLWVLCAGCRAKTVHLGVARPTSDGSEPVVV